MFRVLVQLYFSDPVSQNCDNMPRTATTNGCLNWSVRKYLWCDLLLLALSLVVLADSVSRKPLANPREQIHDRLRSNALNQLRVVLHNQHLHMMRRLQFPFM